VNCVFSGSYGRELPVIYYSRIWTPVLLVALAVTNGQASSAGVTEREAQLLIAVLSHRGHSDAIVEPGAGNHNASGLDIAFYDFELISPIVRPGSGARIATYAVNRLTGTVWDVQGSFCTKVVSPLLEKQLSRFHVRVRLSEPEYNRVSSLKPTECD
jgi:hypothetical protein